MTSPPSRDELHRLRQAWLDAEQAGLKWTTLADKREELHFHTEKLQHEIEFNQLLMQQKSDPDEIHGLEKQILSQRQLLSQLKSKKSSLDHTLDALEESSQEYTDLLKAKLTAALLDMYPERKSSLEAIQSVQNLQRRKQLAVEQAYQATLTLIQSLEIIANERQSIRRQGFLRYIFGANPNVVITLSLRKAENSASAIIAFIQQIDDPSLRAEFALLEDFLKQFCQQCRQRWGFRRIDFLTSQALEVLRNYEKIFETKRIAFETAKQELDMKLHQWLTED